MLENLKRIAAGPKPPTLTDLRAARDEIDTQKLEEAVCAAEREVRETLLSGSEKALERAEAALLAARRDLDRGRFAREALISKIKETEVAETAAALDAARDAAEAEAKAVSADLRRIYAKASNEIVAVLNRLFEAEEHVAKINTKLAAAGRSEFVEPVEKRVFPVPPDSMIHESVVSVLRHTSLRPVPGAPGFGDSAHAFHIAGLRE